MFLSQKWLFYFCTFLITLCPRKNRIKATNTRATTHLPVKGETQINFGNLDTSEPGFDFTDEEIKKLKIWPQGIIPYFIDDFSFDKVLRDKLRAFLEHTNTVAGVQFSELSQPPSDDSRWVFFINRRGVLPCADLDFRNFNNTGVQKVVIGYDCMEPGDLAEMVLAVVGVPPQHNSPHRDIHVQVQKNNILPGKEHLFEKFSDTEWLFHEVEYDFTSAGHYGYHKYTANGRATLKPLKVVDIRTGEATSFSSNDIWKIRMLYNYISKKGRKDKSCLKLFKPGAKFRDFIPDDDDDEDEGKPRSKPIKYIGLPEEKLPDRSDVDDISKENFYKGQDKKRDDSYENNNKVEKKIDQKVIKSKLKRPVDVNQTNQSNYNQTTDEILKIKNILYTSDFQTDE